MYLTFPAPKQMLIVWNVVNWMFIIPRIKKIFPPLYGFMAVVWKEEVNLFPGN